MFASGPVLWVIAVGCIAGIVATFAAVILAAWAWWCGDYDDDIDLSDGP